MENLAVFPSTAYCLSPMPPLHASQGPNRFTKLMQEGGSCCGSLRLPCPWTKSRVRGKPQMSVGIQGQASSFPGGIEKVEMSQNPCAAPHPHHRAVTTGRVEVAASGSQWKYPQEVPKRPALGKCGTHFQTWPGSRGRYGLGASQQDKGSGHVPTPSSNESRCTELRCFLGRSWWR